MSGESAIEVPPSEALWNSLGLSGEGGEQIRRMALHSELPVYVLNLGLIREALSLFSASSKAALGPQARVHYSVKTNSHPALLEMAGRLAYGFETVTGEEIQVVREYDRPVVLNGPHKNIDDLEALAATSEESCLVLDSQDDLQGFGPRRFRGQVGVRLSHLLPDGRLSRFGHSPQELGIVLERASELGVPITGIHIHTGRRSAQDDRLLEALALHVDSIRHLWKNLRWLSFGGGFDSSFVLNGSAEMTRYFEAVGRWFETNGLPLEGRNLIFEPGRCLTEKFGFLVGSIVNTKERDDGPLATVSWGVNDFVAAFRGNSSLTFMGSEPAPLRNYRICGANCFESEQVATTQDIPFALRRGDIVIGRNCGAYNYATRWVWTRNERQVVLIG